MLSTTIYPSLNGKAVFITGGASGIGRTMVERFAAQHAVVKFVDIDTVAGERRYYFSSMHTFTNFGGWGGAITRSWHARWPKRRTPWAKTWVG